jgi:hypothetical protein
MGGALQKLTAPSRDLVGVHIELLSQFGRRLLALDGNQGHLRLKCRRVIAAGSSRHGCSCSRPYWPPSGRKSTYPAVQIFRATSVDNLLDFARGRLGGGIVLRREPVVLEEHLTHVVDELRSAWPEREITVAFDLPMLIDCDAGRLSQLLSNLVGNALTHGSADGPVEVRAFTDNGMCQRRSDFRPVWRSKSRPLRVPGVTAHWIRL